LSPETADDLQFLFCFLASFPSLQSFTKRLILSIAIANNEGYENDQLDLDNSVLLPLFTRKSAVVFQLASILPKSNEPASPLLMTKVNFLVSMLDETSSFSLQEIEDFEQLLSSIETLVKSRPLTAKQVACAAEFPKELQFKGKLRVPMQLLKNYWQKCLNCGNLQFGS
jgi:hypothetical protein